MGCGTIDTALADHDTAVERLPQAGLCYHFLRRMPDTMGRTVGGRKECRNG
jgi:hypothetical protein